MTQGSTRRRQPSRSSKSTSWRPCVAPQARWGSRRPAVGLPTAALAPCLLRLLRFACVRRRCLSRQGPRWPRQLHMPGGATARSVHAAHAATQRAPTPVVAALFIPLGPCRWCRRYAAFAMAPSLQAPQLPEAGGGPCSAAPAAAAAAARVGQSSVPLSTPRKGRPPQLSAAAADSCASPAARSCLRHPGLPTALSCCVSRAAKPS